ncbi:MAG: Maf family protein [Alphaproteobacteria bacterium]|nr:Maf family protein [Alphaproteobacteria bacterium]
MTAAPDEQAGEKATDRSGLSLGGRLVLASASAARTAMLTAAGVPHEVVPAQVDEAAIKAAIAADDAAPQTTTQNTAQIMAQTLGETKARQVATRRPGAIVLGADQILECGATLYDKPASMEAARAQLLELAGRVHRLWTSVSAVRDGQLLWHHNEAPELTMRGVGEDFIETYLEAAGQDVLQSVGAYRLEGLGVQLFDTIEGNHFTVLGMPLLPVLRFLRANSIIAS